jgi:hydroxymethylglutaryl-CoA reductase (NADPH)
MSSISAYLLPARLRGSDETGASAKPKWLNRRITPVLLSLSRRACIHPIYTLVFVAIMASTTYLGLLESSLFDRQISVSHAPGLVDVDTLLQGSKNLFVGEESGWKWIQADTAREREADEVR